MKFPETEVETYKMWKEEKWFDLILDELGELLKFVRVYPIDGLAVMGIRAACFTPFGQEDQYNRRVWLYMNEIEAYNGGKVDEEALAREWQLSGITRP